MCHENDFEMEKKMELLPWLIRTRVRVRMIFLSSVYLSFSFFLNYFRVILNAKIIYYHIYENSGHCHVIKANKATTKTKVEKQKLIDNRRQLHVLFLPKVLILLWLYLFQHCSWSDEKSWCLGWWRQPR